MSSVGGRPRRRAIVVELPDDTTTEALVEMSRKRLGMTAVVDDSGRLLVQLADGTSSALDAGEVHLQPAT